MFKNFHLKNSVFSFTRLVVFLFVLTSASCFAQTDEAYTDTTYFSAVFGHEKIYRIYLPQGYTTSGRRYPVIYFFHGWGGRYNKDDNANLAYRKIKEVADTYQTIIVMVDGNIDTTEPRPYNVGYHNDVKFNVQMKDYFPELIGHIDSTYRTLTDRVHRGIMGFSMGGFTGFYLAGKYPDKVSAAVSFAGSPEFFVGYPSSHTLYPNRYTFENLRQVNTALRNGSEDILYFLNEEVHSGALWDEKVQLQYWPFKGPHKMDERGETKVFEKGVQFIVHTFDSVSNLNNKQPEKWSHYDLYPAFNIWNYKIESNKEEPGFLYLKNVDRAGFGFYTKRWLPDGPPLNNIQSTITTAPVYNPGREYNLLDYDKAKSNIALNKIKATRNGNITVPLNGGGHEIGIFKPDDNPAFIFLDYTVASAQHSHNKSKYLQNTSSNRLSIQILNRGGENNLPGNIKIEVTAKDTSVHTKNHIITIKAEKKARIINLPPFILSCFKKPPPHAEPAAIRFYIKIDASWGKTEDEFIVPVFYNVPEFTNIKIDDGILIRDSAYGKGNADGMVNAGERIMLYQDTNRLRLYTEDPYVIANEEKLADEIIPARWPDGYTLSSVIKISPDCPLGHEIEFLASYETKTFNPIERKLHWGKVKIKVQ
ncbi:alpha/beta hydrolase [Parafilimonas sp.]|uniref:alpha/beta hydrolase n=1 Tax=Parafilimonas sp. TaxID=1969739 RepID=UPI0039E31B1F